jgi:hypothetical protein
MDVITSADPLAWIKIAEDAERLAALLTGSTSNITIDIPLQNDALAFMTTTRCQ